MTAMISVQLNGEKASLPPQNLADAMQYWQFVRGECAVAINGEFVPRSAYATTQLNDGDAIDVVSAVGGG